MKANKNRKKNRKRNISQKVGRPPGDLLFTGERKMEKTNINLLSYNQDEIEETFFATINEVIEAMDPQKISWLNIDGLHEVDITEKIIQHFNLHKLSGEGILNTNQRPKLDDYDEYIHITTKNFYVENDNIEEEQITIIFGPKFLITFQEKENELFNNFRKRLTEGKSQARKKQSDYLAYNLLDAIIDQYYVAIESFGDNIDSIENEVIMNPSEKLLSQLNELKQDISYLRRTIFPLREALNQFEKLELPYIHKETRLFIRDLRDHTIQVIETINIYKDSINSLTDLYMSSLSIKMNNVMKVLTIVSTIFIPLTFIVGVYGMNFTNMPELEYKYGYFITLIFMAILTLFMILYFKHKKWL